MRILGGLIAATGLGTVFAGIINYWAWISLKSSLAENEPLTEVQKRFVEIYGHGSFWFLIVMGAVVFAGGLKLFRRRR